MRRSIDVWQHADRPRRVLGQGRCDVRSARRSGAAGERHGRERVARAGDRVRSGSGPRVTWWRHNVSQGPSCSPSERDPTGLSSMCLITCVTEVPGPWLPADRPGAIPSGRSPALGSPILHPCPTWSRLLRPGNPSTRRCVPRSRANVGPVFPSHPLAGHPATREPTHLP